MQACGHLARPGDAAALLDLFGTLFAFWVACGNSVSH
jgi:hypothetical protein